MNQFVFKQIECHYYVLQAELKSQRKYNSNIKGRFITMLILIRSKSTSTFII